MNRLLIGCRHGVGGGECEVFLLSIREDCFAVLSISAWEELLEKLIPGYALVNAFKIFF